MNDLPRQRLRLRYRKDEILMYISHRDLLRFVMRILRRAEIPFATTGKFSPKPKVTFGPALPLGVMADNELLDIELEPGLVWELEDVKHCAAAIRDATSPRDFLAGMTIVKHGMQPLGKSITAARYLIDFADGEPIDRVSGLMDSAELVITDKKERTVDLKKPVRHWETKGNSLLIDSGLQDGLNLNITLLAELITSRCDATPQRLTRLGFLDNMNRPL